MVAMKIFAMVLLLIVGSISLGLWSFNRNFKKDLRELYSGFETSKKEILTLEMISDLPNSVQLWLNYSKVVGKTKSRSLKLVQKGEMRLKPEDQKWIKAKAVQYFRIDEPAFIWKVKLDMVPLIPVAGKDKYHNGKGSMLIKLLSLFKMVHENGPKIDQGAAQRYLAEICWFPSAVLSPYVSWDSIGALSAKATINYKGTKGSVIFHFNEEGKLLKLSADRFKENTVDAVPEKWIITPLEFAEFNGRFLPSKLNVTWSLNSGDFTWYRLEVTDMNFDFKD